jgi:formylglycine-generating enzyme required for sulfatase activity
MNKLAFLLPLCFTQTVSATAELSFSTLKPMNHVGECISLTLQENLQVASRFHRVDLWAAVQLPSGDFLFMTPLAFQPFDPIPQFFRESLEATKKVHNILDFEVVKGLGGTYTFYAAYVAEDKNPLADGDSVYQSNLVQVSTTLSDEPPLIPVIDCVAVLPAPTDLFAEAGDGSVRVIWKTVTDAVSYVIYWQGSDGSGDILSVPAISHSYMHTGLVNGVSYRYWMTAKDAAGVEGVTSLMVIAIPKEIVKPPSAPVALSAEAGDGQVIFSWQAVPGAVSYLLYWEAGGAVDSFSMSETVFTHNGLVNGTSHTYWVTAVNAEWLESSASARLTATPQAAPPPVVVPPPVVTPPVVVPPPVVTPLPTIVASPGEVFRDTLRDGGSGPEMVMIPTGSFQMGDIQGGGYSDEQPVHWVSVNAFAMGRYEVTVREFRQFVNATGYVIDAEKEGGCYVDKDGDGVWEKVDDANWRNPYFSQGDNQPVTCVSWNDATAYTTWLSLQTGQQYRLPTEAEWEYAARAGTETKYWWGNEASHEYANYGTDSCCNGLAEGKDQWVYTSPVGSFAANPFGLYDTAGNVLEWTCSEYESSYNGKEEHCVSDAGLFVLRGGSWNGDAAWARSTGRVRSSRAIRGRSGGFRPVRLL